jgi:hypothetical protein
LDIIYSIAPQPSGTPVDVHPSHYLLAGFIFFTGALGLSVGLVFMLLFKGPLMVCWFLPHQQLTALSCACVYCSYCEVTTT